MYGLGIRLGLYLQWMTTSMANNFVPEEAIVMRGVNNSFQLATFVALVYTTLTRLSSAESGSLYAVEAFVVLMLCAGGVCSGRGLGNSLERNKSGHATSTTFANYKETQIGQLVRILIGSAIVYYGVWLIYSGLDSMAHPPCSRTAFFFARVDLYHWFRTLLKVIFTIAAIYSSAILLSTLYGVIVLCRRLGFVSGMASILGFNEEQPSAAAPDPRTDGSGKPVTTLTHTSFSFELPLFILMIELMIKWNKIAGVHTISSTGQLIPLVVGGSGFVRVLYKALYKAARGEYCKISYLLII
jgi:hypothetical protein